MTDQTPDLSGAVPLDQVPTSSSVVVRLAPPGHVIQLDEVVLGSAGPAVILSIDGDLSTPTEMVFRADGGGFDSGLQLVGLVQAIGSGLLDHLKENEPENYALIRETMRNSLRNVLAQYGVQVSLLVSIDDLLDSLVEAAL